MTEAATEFIHPKSILEWRQWLERNHSRTFGIWLITFKQATGKLRIAYDDAVEIALCFGWIYSKPRTLDAERSMLWFSPRKKGSAWSKKNKERVVQLVTANRMHEAGVAKIDEAKQDGNWTKLDGVEALEIPPDLRKEFKSSPGSSSNFDAFPRSTKRAIFEWIGNAKTEATRAKRVSETATLAAENIRANQWTKKQ
jgi:uncharacterized protein YdeI (YjbR/CyaY-like superfamily)